jgi:hypothetical protein
MFQLPSLQIRLGTPEHFALTSIFDREVDVADTVYRTHAFITSLIMHRIRKANELDSTVIENAPKGFDDAFANILVCLHNEALTRPNPNDNSSDIISGENLMRAWISVVELKEHTEKMVSALGLKSIEVEFLDDNPQRNGAGERLFLKPLTAFGYDVKVVIVEGNKKETVNAVPA